MSQGRREPRLSPRNTYGPVTITGTGEDVKTAELVATGYTVAYRASSWTLIVSPVNADGSGGPSLINASGEDTSRRR